MKIVTHIVPPLDTNCYFISDGESLAVIDPGGGATQLIAALEKTGLVPSAIFLTHGHFDHVGAAGTLRAHFHIPIYIHTLDAPMLESAEASQATRFGLPFSPCSADICFEEGDSLPLGNTSLTVLHTPGHTPGSSSFLSGDVLFSGDTLFAGSIGNFPPAWAQDMHSSFLRLLALSPDTRVFPGHASSTTILTEQLENPFLKFNWELA